MSICKNCGHTLISDEIALSKKLINRGSTDFMCIKCLSEYFSVPTDLLREKIQQFKDSGCTLFK